MRPPRRPARTRLARPLAVAAVALAAAASTSAAATASGAGAFCPGEISVVGRGAVTAAPDLLAVEFSVQTQAEDPADAFSEAARRTAAVIEALRAGGVAEADVATSGLSLGPVFERMNRDGSPEITGWTASASLSVRVRALDAFGALASSAVAAGANGLSSARLEVSDAEARLVEARAAAVRDALERAAAMAEAAGLALGPVLSISEGGGAPGPRPFAGRAMAMAEAMSDMPIAAGEQTLEARVALVAALCP